MPRRGKAATRHARQRRAQTRPATTAPAAVPQGAPDTGEPATSDAAPVTTPRAGRAGAASGTSALSARARDEYHYVGRDLRNIGVLAVIMLAILIVAFVVSRAVGAGG